MTPIEGMTEILLRDVQLDLCLSFYLTTIATKNELSIRALNATDHVITVPQNQPIARFLILTVEEAEWLISISAEILKLDKTMNGEVFEESNATKN